MRLAKPPGRKLKVFQAQIGFWDTVVAVPGKAAALRAWGVHQDLFANGQARLAADSKAVDAALAHPGAPLRRAVGSTAGFELEPTALPKPPRTPKKARPPAARGKPAKPASPPADRQALDEAEEALRQLDRRRWREEDDLRRRQDEFDEVRARAQQTYVEQRKRATASVAEARKAYRRAGGRD